MFLNGGLEEQDFHFKDIFSIAVGGEPGDPFWKGVEEFGDFIKIPLKVVEVTGELAERFSEWKMVLRFSWRQREYLTAWLEESVSQMDQLLWFFCLKIKEEDEIGKAGEENASEGKSKEGRSTQKGKKEYFIVIAD